MKNGDQAVSMVGYRLSFMMFLQFFIWGGWFVTLGTFLASNLSATGAQVGMAFSTQSWGAIIAPFIIGLIADRYFNAEKILGVLHLVGAVLLFQMHRAADFAGFYPLVLGYMVVYMPTLALVNAVAFRQMDDPAKEFARIRVWGTIGWIVAGLIISFVFSWDSQENISNGLLSNTFLLSSCAAFVLGLFSFTLPATAPANRSKERVTIGEIVGADAFGLLKDRNFAVFFVSSILICIPLAFYYQNANPFLAEIGVTNPTGKMTIGQISEVGFMLLLPVFLKRFGIKFTLLVGMIAWLLRYLLFAFGDADGLLFMLILGIALHGICYDFFFVTGQIYTNSKAGPRYRSSAQGMITLATYGLGMLIGFTVAGYITDVFADDGLHDWLKIWVFPALFASIVAVIFLLAFKKEDLVIDETVEG
jgi:nucleoside transporter